MKYRSVAYTEAKPFGIELMFKNILNRCMYEESCTNNFNVFYLQVLSELTLLSSDL